MKKLGFLILAFALFAAGLAQADYTISNFKIVGTKIVATGNLTFDDYGLVIGAGGTPDVTVGDEDLYVKGTFEVDGASRMDNILDIITATANPVEIDTTLAGASSAVIIYSNNTDITGQQYLVDLRIVDDNDTDADFAIGRDNYDQTPDTLFRIDSTGEFVSAVGYTGTGATAYDAGGAAAITIGSADVTSVTVTVDGTGTGEFVLPAGAIDAAEQTNAGKTFVVTLMIPDISTADTIYAAMPKCTVISVITALEATITAADAIVNLYKNGTTITGSPITVANSGSLPGTFDSATPTADNTFNGTSDVFWLGNEGASSTASNLTVSLVCTSTD